MTANNFNGISPAHAQLAVIENVDSFALKLYKRARNAGRDFEDIAFVVRNLHTVLRHLKIEAGDPESLLNVEGSGVYTRQLIPIIEDCEFHLKQLDTIMERHSGHLGGRGDDDPSTKHRTRMEGELGWTMENVEREKIDLIRHKLMNEKLNIDIFLDTIQLHNPAKSRTMVDTTRADLDSIKDKVDAIASRICQRKNSGLNENEEDLWLRFRNELEREGFSKDVLRKNQDVLRAYIRQLDERTVADGGATPSVRRFLEADPSLQDYNGQSQMTPYPGYPPGDADPRTSYPDLDDEIYFPSTKMERLHGDSYDPAQVELTNPSYGSRSSDDDDAYPSQDSMGIISTRDLMALDKRNVDLGIAMDNMHLQSTPSAYGNSAAYALGDSPPTSRYLPPSASQPALLASSPPTNALDQYGTSPRYVPPVLSPTYDNNSPPLLHPNSISVPNLDSQQSNLVGQAVAAQRPSRLAPDSQGKEIPLDATWTRIRRSLVSPEVLAQAGVRYEARPDFVAVLGSLTKDEVADFARRSAEVRKKRNRAVPGTRKERRPEDRYYPDKYRNWEVESSRSLPNGGYVINPNGRRRSQVSTGSELYDSSDDSSDTETDQFLDDEHDKRSPSSRRSAPYAHNTRDHHKDFRHSRDRNDSGVSNVSTAKSQGGDGEQQRGTKTYPYIVPPPKEDTSKESAASPSATSLPKPILKNKNADPHVRFDPEPHILDDSTSSPRKRHGERERDRDRDWERDRDRDRDGHRDGHRDSSYRERDGHREREKKYYADRYSERDHRHADRDRRERDRYDRERDRDRDRDRDRRYSHSSSTPGSARRDRDARPRRRGGGTSDALKAVGIGGAAASLLSVLTEAASGF